MKISSCCTYIVTCEDETDFRVLVHSAVVIAYTSTSTVQEDTLAMIEASLIPIHPNQNAG